jgi:exopolyphosphatase/guanosine-5'-triphosphate,3'-diphosphate pyrophosphatase
MNKTDFASYINIITPLLWGKADLDKIITLSIMLISLQHKFDRTLAPTAIAEFILSSEIPFTHKTRIMLALILSYTTNYKPSNELIKISKRIITKEDHNNCQIIGHFLSIAEAIDGLFLTSPSFKINVKNHYLEIDSNELLPRPIFEKICNRLKSIAFARRTNY